MIYTNHESLKYLVTIRNPSKRLAQWVKEFSKYDINLQYRKGSEQVIPNAISRRPDLMGEGPYNLAQQVFLICGLEEDTWAWHMQEFLNNRTTPPAPLQKEIYEKRHEFTSADGYLWKVTDGIRSPYVQQALRADFIK